MTIASHAIGPEFDSRWEYFFFSCIKWRFKSNTNNNSLKSSKDKLIVQSSEVAQRKRVGLITQRSEDRNLPSLFLLPSFLNFLKYKKFPNRELNPVFGANPWGTRSLFFWNTKKFPNRELNPGFLVQIHGVHEVFFFWNTKKFPNRELNPGLSGESRVSWPPRLLGRSLCFRPGSNRRPWDYETHALPTAPRKLWCCDS